MAFKTDNLRFDHDRIFFSLAGFSTLGGYCISKASVRSITHTAGNVIYRLSRITPYNAHHHQLLN